MNNKFLLFWGLCALCALGVTGCGASASKSDSAQSEEKKEVRLYDVLDSVQLGGKFMDFPEELSVALGLTEARYLIYMTDVNCSACISDYLKLSRFFVKNQNLCDSIITVAYGDQDFLKVEFYAKKYGVQRIPYERVYVDNPRLPIAGNLYALVPKCNMLLVENHRLIYALDFHAFEPDAEGDLKCSGDF